jgi:hypothetical protein
MRVQFAAPLATLIALAIISGCVPHGAPVTAPAEKTAEPFVATLTVEARDVAIHSEPSRSTPVVESLRSGDRLRLIERGPEWLLVVAPSGVRGYVEGSSLVSPECTSDRAEPLIVEEPVFWFSQEPPHGIVVLEAEYSAEARLVAAHVLENTVSDPSFEQHAIDDLRRMRFLPPTDRCEPLPFFYTFTRRF